MDAFVDDTCKISFEGVIYRRVKPDVTKQELEEYISVAVSEEIDEGYDVWNEGPGHLIFSKALYEKVDEEPALMAERIIRTVDPMEPRGSEVEIEQLDVAMDEEIENTVIKSDVLANSSEDMTNTYESDLQNNPLQPASSIQQPPSASSDPDLSGFYPMPSELGATHFTMPRLATKPSKAALEPFFDLPESYRHGLQYTIPPRENMYPPQVATSSKPPKHRMTLVQDKCFFALVEAAVRILGRRLKSGDFKAITEAFHRYCPPADGAVYRGYNTLHSTATKRNARYEELVKHLLEGVPKTEERN